MAAKYCSNCGAPLQAGLSKCKYCNTPIPVDAGGQAYQAQPAQQAHQQQTYQQPQSAQQAQPDQQTYQQPQSSQTGYQQAQSFDNGGYSYGYHAGSQSDWQNSTPVYEGEILSDGVEPWWPLRNRIAAGILAIVLGGFGVHKFYLGRIGLGILYLVFAWTFIPWVAGVVEGILYLCDNDENFQRKHHVRLN